MENNFTYKWKIFASKRYPTKDGVIKLTPEEQQELIDDSCKLHQHDVSRRSEQLVCPKCGAVEVEAMTPRTVYTCGSSDYDQRPNTFSQSEQCCLSES